jgi:hypothetical protein
MSRVGIYDPIESAIQDLVAPALHEITGQLHAVRADIQRLDQKILGVDQKLGYMNGELLAEIRRVDKRELRTSIDIRERLAALEGRRA